ncbi:MAG TPA: prepilin-type N-terminal cleavage/methylation domain-containing protein [Candidatus Saccharimonadales bacterium]
MQKQLKNGGYTLLELLVVIIIACILVGLIIINVVSK